MSSTVYYSHSQYETINEMFHGLRGRCPFKVYMPNKPNRYSIKMYAMCDDKVFYMVKLKVYVGKQPIGLFAVLTANIELLSRLSPPIWREI